MDNVIKNIITTDNIANLILQKYMSNKSFIEKFHKDGIEHIANNYFTIVMFSFHEYRIFEEYNRPTITFLIFHDIIMDYFTNNYDSNNYDIKKINKIIYKTIKDNYKKYDDDRDFNEKFLQGKINKKENNSYLLEIALFFGFIYDDFDLLIDNIVKYVKTITINTIKTLTFISIGILAFYAKTFYKTKDSLFAINMWIDKLIDIFIEKTIDSKLPHLDNIDKKKFIFMLMRYNSDFKCNESEFAFERSFDINSCSIVKFNENKFLPGYTADQCFLFIYDACLKCSHSFEFLLFTALTFTEIKHITFISSWLFFLSNPNFDFYKKFEIINGFQKIDEFVEYFNNLFKKNLV